VLGKFLLLGTREESAEVPCELAVLAVARVQTGPTGFTRRGELDAVGWKAVFEESQAHAAGDIVIGEYRE
jgi:hypothetical protein